MKFFCPNKSCEIFLSNAIFPKISSKNIIFRLPFNNNSLETENDFLLIDSIANELCNKPKLEETLLLRMFQEG
jgi:hypothetical protein